MTFDLEERILQLYKANRWSEVLELLNENHDNHVRRKFLWIVPKLDDVFWIKDVLLENNLKGIVSVGCGSGLLERLVQEYTGFEVIGVEVDRKWWRSGYSPPLFLQNVIFADESEGKISHLHQTNYVLMFCYFNNERAFLAYMRQYKGDVVIVIGPEEGQNRHTCPMPYDRNFLELGWRLCRVRQLKTSRDLMAVFVRFRRKTSA